MAVLGWNVIIAAWYYEARLGPWMVFGESHKFTGLAEYGRQWGEIWGSGVEMG